MNMAEFSKEIPPDEPDIAKPSKRIAGISILSVLGSFAKKIGIVGAVYLLGYFQFSVAWLISPIIFSVIRDEWKKEKDLKRNIAKASALCNEKEVILARIDDLPSWVFFPDVERAEWINKILRQVWPNVNHYAKGLIKEVIEPAIAENLASYKVYNFQFQKMHIGSIPPRIGGVKVYDKNVSRNEILMDLDVFYAGDCDISFSLSGISGGIKDFQIHGMLRVVMKPLIAQIPMIGGLQVFFLNNPTIDFNLVGMADVLDMPGLSDLLRRIIVEQVAAMMVLPNKLPIHLSDAVPATTLKTPEPEGVLRVHVIEAKDLMKKDIGVLGKGKSDPYAILTVGAQIFRTKIIDNTVNPKWDYWCEFAVDALSQQLNVQLKDHDELSKKDSKLGRATIEINQIAKKREVDTWITLEDAKHGLVHLRLTWLRLSSNPEDLKLALAETQQLRVTSMSSALLMIFIDSVKNLPNARPQSKPDPIVTVTLCKASKTTNMQWRTDNPVFEQGFTFLVNNPVVDTMHVKVTDNKTGRDIGELEYNVSQLLDKPNMSVDNQPFQLKKSSGDSKIILNMELKILKFEPPLETDDDVSVGGRGDSDSLSRTESMKRSPPNTPTEKSAPFLKHRSSQKSIKSVEGLTIGPNNGNQSEDFIKEESDVQKGSVSGANLPRTNSTVSSGSFKMKGEHGLGRILLTFNYNVKRQRLEVVVKKVENLPVCDPMPDPYVKLYMLPERSRDSKRKTDSKKDTCNPVYDDAFEFVLSQAEISSKQLEVTVNTRKGIFPSYNEIMGQVVIDLGELDTSKSLTEWFDLVPAQQRDKDD